jgi:DNA-binding NarL/FixJ family response regulator
MDNPTLKIILFDDSKTLRESLISLFSVCDDMQLIGAYPSCSNAIEEIEKEVPDVILMDINMPEMCGIDGVTMIKEAYPSIPILMQTVFEDEDKIFSAIEAGASGYILKSEKPENIIEAIRELNRGGAPMSSVIAAKVFAWFKKNKSPNHTYQLTLRETQILKKLTEGMSYKMIASDFNVSYHTVNAHIRNIYDKLHVNSMGEAIAKALKERIV